MSSSVFRCVACAALLTAAACTSLPPGAALPKSRSTAIAAPAGGTLGRAFTPRTGASADESGFTMVSAGIDGLTARTELIDSAQHTVDLQYYIFRADNSGNVIAQALLRAAERGVRVRILVDDGDTVAGDEKILALTAHADIEVRIFNPFRYRGHNSALRGVEFLLRKSRLDYRMHNKLMVADNTVALIGGRNIGDQYFQIDPNSQFGDDDVIVAGPMVPALSATFDEFWNATVAVPARAVDARDTSPGALSAYVDELARFRQRLDAEQHSHSPGQPGKTPLADILSGSTPLIRAHAELAYDAPNKKQVDKGEARGARIYQPVLERAAAANVELLLVTPYFVPAPDELAALESARARHAKVRVLTNSLEAAPSVAAAAGYAHYRVRLLRDGVELYEVRALLGRSVGSGQTKAISKYGHYGLHAKMYAFDRHTLFVGSMNLDERSRHLNTEIGLLIASPELSRQFALRFDELVRPENAYSVSLRETPQSATEQGGAALLWTTRRGKEMVHETREPARSAWQRFEMKLLSTLPLDSEL